MADATTEQATEAAPEVTPTPEITPDPNGVDNDANAAGDGDNLEQPPEPVRTNSLQPKSTFLDKTPIRSVSYDVSDVQKTETMRSEQSNLSASPDSGPLSDLANEATEATDKLSALGSDLEKQQSMSREKSVSKGETLKKYLPYYEEFYARTEKSVLNMKDFNNDPEGYLQALLDKYTIDHLKDFKSQQQLAASASASPRSEAGTSAVSLGSLGQNASVSVDTELPQNPNEMKKVFSKSTTKLPPGHALFPWIEGTLDKLMPEPGMFGRMRYKSRLFRLFDEALVWFDDPNIVSKWLHKNETTMRPLGVLPLAMVTALRTVDMSKNVSDISEDDLLKLELQVGNEGVIVLRCSDYRQRIKWFECLHAAIFSVPKPLFTQKQGLWRINEEQAKQGKKQLTTEILEEKEEQRRKISNIHVRMGTSLVLTVEKMKRTVTNLGTPQAGPSDLNGIDENAVAKMGGISLGPEEELGGGADASPTKNASGAAGSGAQTRSDTDEKETTPLSKEKQNKAKKDMTVEMSDVGKGKDNGNKASETPVAKPGLKSTESAKKSRKIL